MNLPVWLSLLSALGLGVLGLMVLFVWFCDRV